MFVNLYLYAPPFTAINCPIEEEEIIKVIHCNSHKYCGYSHTNIGLLTMMSYH